MNNLRPPYYSHNEINYYGFYSKPTIEKDIIAKLFGNDKMFDFGLKSIKKIMVPTDFSTASDVALLHAADFASSSEASIILFHICKTKEEIKQAKKMILKQAQIISDSMNVRVKTAVRIGNINDIPRIIVENSIDIVFIPTHGAKGLQKILGSYLLKLSCESEKSFVVIQEDTLIPTKGYASYFENYKSLGKTLLLRKNKKLTPTLMKKEMISIKNDLKNNFFFKYWFTDGTQNLITNKSRIPICILNGV
jgi:hypothetical protein